MRRVFAFLFVLLLVGCVVPTPTPESPTPTVSLSPLVIPISDDGAGIPKLKFGGETMESMSPAETLVIAVFLALVAERLVKALVAPIFDKFQLDKFWLMYIAWVIAGGLVWLSSVNLFGAYLPDPLVGQILTAIVAGGGANFLHDLFDA